MATGLKRLAREHASLAHGGLPPYYIFPSSGTTTSESLTQLTVLLIGPPGTPYSQGLWRLQLRIPGDYPANPPKAFFKTRIWHPNVEESTGAVCVDTLKRDWDPKLTLKDVLVTISCLLIHPNPDSALNSTAGALLQDNYKSFARQAKLMTSIHAPIPADMKAEVDSRRGTDEASVSQPQSQDSNGSDANTTKPTSSSTLIMKQRPSSEKTTLIHSIAGIQQQTQSSQSQTLDPPSHHSDTDSDSDSENSASKENDPSLSNSPVITPARSPRSVLGKRPLSVLASPEEPDLVLINDDSDSEIEPDLSGMTASERNIAANNTLTTTTRTPTTTTPARVRSNAKNHVSSYSNEQPMLLQPCRKAPRLTDPAKQSLVNITPTSLHSKAGYKKRSPEDTSAKSLSPVISATTIMASKEESPLLASSKPIVSGVGVLNSKIGAGTEFQPILTTTIKKPVMSNLSVRPKPRTGLRRL